MIKTTSTVHTLDRFVLFRGSVRNPRMGAQKTEDRVGGLLCTGGKYSLT